MNEEIRLEVARARAGNPLYQLSLDGFAVYTPVQGWRLERRLTRARKRLLKQVAKYRAIEERFREAERTLDIG